MVLALEGGGRRGRGGGGAGRSGPCCAASIRGRRIRSGGGGFAAGDGDRPGGLTSRLADGALLTSHLGGWLTGRLGGASQLA